MLQIVCAYLYVHRHKILNYLKKRYVPVKLAYNVVEPDEYDREKAPVIFLHGVTASKENWHAIPGHISSITQRKVYVLDARNHGDSPWSEVSHFACNIEDLLHFMDTHNVPKAILVGHSMGGVTAMKVAIRVVRHF
ncbi:UNVERIFIED_CONTAM: abhd11 [Trichonephila clavipes]